MGGMTKKAQTDLVAGEPWEEVARALLRLKRTQTSDGSLQITGVLDREVAAPLVAALMRVEADLLLEDADAVSRGESCRRTQEQRAADALVEVARRLGEVVEQRREQRTG
jgi:hypothetical protein